MSRFTPRQLLALLFLACTGLLAYGLYLQHVVGLEPCPMCILQRYAFVAIALIALIGATHGPRRAGSVVYGVLLLIPAVAGGVVAAQQSKLQREPPSLAECGPGFEYMVENFGLSEALPMMFRGAGDCAAIDWTFLGLTIANWALACFTLVALLAVWLVLRGGRKKPSSLWDVRI
ncbi:MAG: disulfide bond formation protein B [Pseudazoarcus pumilus]|nr:disulfide bond formation protein B [Pseudazoarcus pumilus]